MVSVIIPVYNRAATIERAIRSVLDQTYPDFEVIVVDDGSHDGSAQIVRELQHQSDRIRYFHQENTGPSAARNRGIAAANGEYIAFLDSDDYWFPPKLDKQIAFLNANRDYGFAYCWAEVISKSAAKSYHRPTYAGHVFEKLLGEQNFVVTSSVVVRRAVLHRIGGFNEQTKGPEDLELWLRIAHQFKIACVEDILVRKYQESESSLQSDHALMFENLLKVFAENIGRLEDRRKRNRYLASFYRRSIGNYYDVPHIHQYFLKMIGTHPGILAQLLTYRTLLGYLKNSIAKYIRRRFALLCKERRPCEKNVKRPTSDVQALQA